MKQRIQWTEQMVRDKIEKGTIVSAVGLSEQVKGKKVKQSKAVPTGLKHIMSVLDDLKVDYITEYQFDAQRLRRFRFDVAIVALKIACEYEGLMSDKSRHTTKTGYTNDAGKYNLAQSQGWKVLRYTALNYTEFENDIRKVL